MFSLQVFSNAMTRVSGAINVAGGITVVSGGLTVTDGGLRAVDPTSVAGAVSITSTSPTAATVDAYASLSSFTGNALLGRVRAASVNSNALMLLEGNNLLYQVCMFIG